MSPWILPAPFRRYGLLLLFAALFFLLTACGGGGGGETPGLPPTSTTAEERAERTRIHDAVNAERQAVGLAPLMPRDDLSAVAQAHAEDMNRRGYTSHISPEGRDWDARLAAAGITSLIRGENTARNRSSALALAGWRASPDHREGIFLPEYRNTGIGVSRIDPNQAPWNQYELNGDWYHFVQLFTD